MGFPPFLSEITAIVSQKSSLEANWGVKMKPTVRVNTCIILYPLSTTDNLVNYGTSRPRINTGMHVRLQYLEPYCAINGTVVAFFVEQLAANTKQKKDKLTT